jgi:hypothetical protein
MLPQERLFRGPIALADFPEHPAGRFVNEVMRIVA